MSTTGTTGTTLSWIDAGAGLALATTLVVATGAYLVRVLVLGVFRSDRAEREGGGSFLLGSDVMAAGMWAAEPLVRLAVRLGISADALTLASLPLALAAAIAFATGHFGSAALFGAFASLLDVLDGAVARATRTASARGKLLDTVVDRWVDALLFGGLVVTFHDELLSLVVALGALVGAQLVSYASALAREAAGGEAATSRGLMRRAERLVWLVGAALASEIVGWTGPSIALVRAPLLLVLGAVALLGNVSALRRMLALRAVAPGDRASVETTAATSPTPSSGPADAALAVTAKSPEAKKLHAPPGFASH